MRMRRKKNLDKRLERVAHMLVSEQSVPAGGWRALLPQCTGIYIELGCGRGRFTVETAKQCPDVLIVAVEREENALITAVELAEREALPNTRFISGDASSLGGYFAEGEVDRIYINFCDPWPSSRHIKRRLTSPSFLEIYSRILCPGGEIHFKTDNLPLFEYSLRRFEDAGYRLSEVTRDLHAEGIKGVMTDYELKFHSEGKKICRCVAARRA
ncbi:MAG: tRNA (guanosine(46)-N7)-methyltransferase TrmB [Oscillospiraceae bacterium]|jgi:tRNA (guanine-N7-)-methyltransferase